MSDVTVQTIVISGFGFMGVLVSAFSAIIIAKINKMHTSVNGLLAEKTLADKALGKVEGIKQEKSDQKERDEK